MRPLPIPSAPAQFIFYFRYFLPIILTSAILLHRRLSPRPTPTSSPPVVTEHALQRALSDLHTINALLPSFPPTPYASTPLLPLVSLLRLCGALYLPYLLLTHLVSLRVLVAITGTVLLTWRAPWAHTARRIAGSSAHIRWAAYRAAAALTGLPLSSSTSPSSSLAVIQSQEGPREGARIRFLFTIHENQRWWVGLDWTSALLPAERAPWSAPAPSTHSSHAPSAVSPPNSFALPAPSVSYLDLGGKGRVKRTARWSWEEPEWRVLVRREGTGASRVERALPKDEGSAGGGGGGGGAVMKAMGRARESFGGGAAGIVSGKDGKDPQGQKEGGTEGAKGGKEGKEGGEPWDGDGDEVLTDADGWVYGDNKWEGGSTKSGMGKVCWIFFCFFLPFFPFRFLLLSTIPWLLNANTTMTVHALPPLDAGRAPLRDHRARPRGRARRRAPLPFFPLPLPLFPCPRPPSPSSSPPAHCGYSHRPTHRASHAAPFPLLVLHPQRTHRNSRQYQHKYGYSSTQHHGAGGVADAEPEPAAPASEGGGGGPGAGVCSCWGGGAVIPIREVVAMKRPGLRLGGYSLTDVDARYVVQISYSMLFGSVLSYTYRVSVLIFFVMMPRYFSGVGIHSDATKHSRHMLKLVG